MLNLPLTFARRPAAPSTPKPWLLVLLHEVASNEHDFLSQVTAFSERFYLLSLRGPHRMGPGAHAWFDFSILPGRKGTAGGDPVVDEAQEAESRTLIAQSIEAACTQLEIAPDHVLVAGFGQGGIMALSMLLTHPELMRAGIVWHGRLLPEILPLQAERDALQGRQLWVSHGTQDSMVSSNYAQSIRRHLENTPLHTTFREFAVGHELRTGEVAATASWVEGLGSAPPSF